MVEDVVRFSWEDGRLAAKLKRERHIISRNCDTLLRKHFKGLKARDTFKDPGRDSMPRSEAARKDLEEILLSNFRRAEEGLRLAEIRYDGGEATELEVMDAREALAQAGSNYSRAVYEHMRARLDLEKATGTLRAEPPGE